jgi:hypothetical protein
MIDKLKQWWHHLLYDSVASRPAFTNTSAEGYRRSSASMSSEEVRAKYVGSKSEEKKAMAYFVGGRVGGMKVELTRTPPRVVVAGQTYDRVDDPDTGEYLGAYALHYEGTCCDN